MLQNKVSIITGGSSGIGLASANAFYREQAKLVITGRDEQKLKQAAESMGPDVLSILSIQCNAMPPAADTDAMLETVVKHYNGIDILRLQHNVTNEEKTRQKRAKKRSCLRRPCFWCWCK